MPLLEGVAVRANCTSPAGVGLPPTVEERSQTPVELRGRGQVEDCLGSLFDVLCARNPASLTIFVHGCGVNGVGCDTLLWSTTARSSVSIARASLLCPYACLPSYSRVNITSSKSMGTCRIDATLTIRDGALPRSVGSSRCVNRNGATYLTANRSSWPSRLISLRPPAGRNQKPHC
jgi:hypothetical protein